MMATTHAAVGLLLALPLAVVAPDLAAAGALAAMAGGVFPDLDLVAGIHRKTLHFPDYYWVGAIPALLAAVLVPTAATVAVAWFLLSAAVHSVSDAFGAGTEPRPWERTSAEAVYLHSRSRWVRPRYWVRYDGAPEDLALSAVLAIPLLVTLDGPYAWLIAGVLAVATVYATLRRVLATVAVRVVTRLPATLQSALPARYRDGRAG